MTDQWWLIDLLGNTRYYLGYDHRPLELLLVHLKEQSASPRRAQPSFHTMLLNIGILPVKTAIKAWEFAHRLIVLGKTCLSTRNPHRQVIGRLILPWQSLHHRYLNQVQLHPVRLETEH